jgi:hypothetical protein
VTESPAPVLDERLAAYVRHGVITADEADALAADRPGAEQPAETPRPDPGPDHWTVETVERVRVTHTQTGKSAEAPTRDEAVGRLVAELVTAGDISINAGRKALGLKPFPEDIGGLTPFDLEADASRLWPMFPHEHLAVGDVFEVTRDGRACALRVTKVIPGPGGQVMYETEPAE